MRCEFSELLSQTLSSVAVGLDEVHFVAASGAKYRLYHRQDCCESVTVEDVIGDPEDLVGSPILMAEAVSRTDRPVVHPPPTWAREGRTWTFYKLATVKGYVTIRFYGTSNGWYSESVDFERCD